MEVVRPRLRDKVQVATADRRTVLRRRLTLLTGPGSVRLRGLDKVICVERRRFHHGSWLDVLPPCGEAFCELLVFLVRTWLLVEFPLVPASVSLQQGRSLVLMGQVLRGPAPNVVDLA